MITTINGQPLSYEPRADETAIEVIRERAGLTGTKMACGAGVCGACTVLVEGTPLCSCLLPANHMEGKQVQTIEYHGPENLHPVQKALMAHDGLQCGFCTPGFANEGIAFYARWRQTHGATMPSREEVATALSGHLCRCGAYIGIYEAIQRACAGDYDAVETIDAPRVDALEKVTGRAKYTVDMKLPHQLEGKILRSPHPHALVQSIDSTAALALEGVVAVADLMEGKKRVRYVGQPVAGVAAVDEVTATKALKLINVTYEVLPHVIDPAAAQQRGAPEVYGDGHDDVRSSAEGFTFPGAWNGNVRRTAIKPTSWRPAAARRHVESARKNRPDHVVERTYRNEQQVHTALEPHTAVAHWPTPHQLTLYTSTQNVHALRSDVAEHFDLEPDQVTVDSQYIGGGFGGKQGLYNETKAAITLARHTEAPVRVVADRLEEISYSSLRPGATMQTAVVTKADGTPEALVYKTMGEGGIAIGTMGAGMYGLMAPRVLRDLEDSNVVTNTAPGTPFRGPDAPSIFWSIEQAIDEVGEKRNLDPVTIRRRWLPDHEIRHRLLDWVEELPIWQERSVLAEGNGRYRQGVGLSMASWLFIYNPDVKVTVSSSPQGITVSTATQDIGNGTRTSLAKAVEDAMGIERNLVTVEIGRADLPVGPVAGGSQVTASVYPTAYAAAEAVVAHLLREAEAKLGLQHVKAGNGGINHDGGFTPWADILAGAEPFSHTDQRGAERGPLGIRMNLSQGEDDPAIGMRVGHIAIVTHLEVDTVLGKVRPIHVWNRLGVGKIFVPELARSQVYGGVIQGIGYALYEQKQYDFKTGQTLSSNLNDYRIPGIGDTPEIDVDFDEAGYEEIRGKGIGLAELATVGVAASVGNAVYHATGWRPTKTPITPWDVVAGMKG